MYDVWSRRDARVTREKRNEGLATIAATLEAIVSASTTLVRTTHEQHKMGNSPMLELLPSAAGCGYCKALEGSTDQSHGLVSGR